MKSGHHQQQQIKTEEKKIALPSILIFWSEIRVKERFVTTNFDVLNKDLSLTLMSGTKIRVKERFVVFFDVKICY